MSTPLTVAYGMGVDSTAVLVGMKKRGQRPDKILFADVGAEKQEIGVSPSTQGSHHAECHRENAFA